jgi:polyisoprenyl-phosphate glycosyltransferase
MKENSKSNIEKRGYVLPCRVGLYMGITSFLASVAMIIWTLYAYTCGIVSPGGFSILIPMLMIGSVQLVSMSIIAEYIGKLFLEVRRERNEITKEKTTDENNLLETQWAG